MTQMHKKTNKTMVKKIELPPIICSCFFGTELLGSFDNPEDLLLMIDFMIQKEFISTEEDLKDEEVTLYFSIVNPKPNFPTFACFTKKDFSNREEVYDLYDMVIGQYSDGLNSKIYDTEDIAYEEDDN